jgi:hypothetical protein
MDASDTFLLDGRRCYAGIKESTDPFNLTMLHVDTCVSYLDTNKGFKRRIDFNYGVLFDRDRADRSIGESILELAFKLLHSFEDIGVPNGTY